MVSIDEYLDTAYSPDREFVDGLVLERRLGERPHSRVQHNLIVLLDRQAPALFAWPGQRIRTAPTRTRIPDICITESDPEVDVFVDADDLYRNPSRRDEMTDVLEKLDEYVEFGVREIWLIDPRRQKTFTYQSSLIEVPAFLLPSYGIDLPRAGDFQSSIAAPVSYPATNSGFGNRCENQNAYSVAPCSR